MAESSSPLRPSAGHRWVPCPGSPNLIASLPEKQRDNANKDAMWGTACHEVLSRSILERRTPNSFVGETIVVDGETERRDFPELKDRSFVITEADAAHVSHAYNHAMTRMREYGAKTMVLVEEKVDIGENFHLMDPVVEIPVEAPLPGYCSGTPDIVLCGGGYLEIIDYKNGQRPVSHVRNPQLGLYLTGVLKQVEMGSVQRVRLTIVQPRAEGMEPVRTDEMTMVEAEDFVMELSAAAHATRVEGAPLVPGDHCRNTFCPAQGICPALNGAAVAALQGLDTGLPPDDDLDEAPDPTNAAVRVPMGPANDPDLVHVLAVEPETMGLDQLARVLDAREMIRSWLNACESHAHKLMMAGETVPGFKLVMGRRDREWNIPEADLIKKFGNWGRIGDNGKTVGKLKKDHYTELKLISPAQAEARIKPMVTPKTWEHIEACYDWSEGKPTLAAETDKREAIIIPRAADVLGIDSGTSDLPEFLQ